MVSPGDVAYWVTKDGQMTVLVHDLSDDGEFAYVTEVGMEELRPEPFEVDVDQLTPV